MSGTSTLRRLLQVLEIEEEQTKIALEAAVAAQRWLEQRLSTAIDRGRGGRRLIAASAQSGDLTDRWVGLEEVRAGAEHAARLKPKIREAGLIVAARRQEYMAKRVERRQAETLIEEAEAREAAEAGRRDQQGLDDWYLNRLARASREQGKREQEKRELEKQEQERLDRSAGARMAGQDAGSHVADEQFLRDADAKT